MRRALAGVLAVALALILLLVVGDRGEYTRRTQRVPDPPVGAQVCDAPLRVYLRCCVDGAEKG